MSVSAGAERPTTRIKLRYAAFQVPGFVMACTVGAAIVYWLDVKPWAAAAGVAIWTLKDVFMFPYVWRAYAPRADGGPHDLRGRTGRTAGDGYVRLGAEHWRARFLDGGELDDGAPIRVVEVEGLTLVVERAEEENAPH